MKSAPILSNLLFDNMASRSFGLFKRTREQAETERGPPVPDSEADRVCGSKRATVVAQAKPATFTQRSGR